MPTIDLKDHLLLVFKPEYVDANTPPALYVLNDGQNFEPVADKDVVRNTITPPFRVSTVVIHVLDEDGRKMTVTTSSGKVWDRNESPTIDYNLSAMNIPPTSDRTYRLEVYISTAGAPRRKLTIELKREVP